MVRQNQRQIPSSQADRAHQRSEIKRPSSDPVSGYPKSCKDVSNRLFGICRNRPGRQTEPIIVGNRRFEFLKKR